MARAIRVGWRSMLVAAPLVAVLVLASASIALAAGPTTIWSGESPAPGAVVAVPPTTVVVKVDCTTSLVSKSRVVTVDGVSCFTTIAIANRTGGGSVATITAYPSKLSNGPHTVVAGINTVAGTTVSRSWSFLIGVPPSLGMPTPYDGAKVDTTSPVIAVPVVNASSVTTFTATLNGNRVPATLSDSTLTVQPPSRLADDATATISVSVSDSLNNTASLTWSFKVQTRGDMTPPYDDSTCIACHIPLPPTAHSWTNGCGDCHDPTPHQGTPEDYHLPSPGVSQCVPCHTTALTSEHGSRGLTCLTCHKSESASVKLAIASNDSQCTSCHGSGIGHVSTHDTFVVEACAGAACHSGSNLTAIHSALTCNDCHFSERAGVTAAIAAHDKNCTACHDAISPHGDIDAKHTANLTTGSVPVWTNHQLAASWLWFTTVNKGVDCNGCHSSKSLVKLHAGVGCQACHLPGGARASFTTWDKSCQQGSCHPTIHNASAAQAGHLTKSCWNSQGGCHSDGLEYSYCAGSCHPAANLKGASLAPTTSWSAIETGTPYGYYTWYKNPAKLKLTVVGKSSGVAGTYYRVGNGAWQYHAGSETTLSASGSATTTVDYFSVDTLGNRETTKTYTFAIDDVAPVTTLYQPYATYFDYGIQVMDVGSGPATAYYSMDGAAWKSVPNPSYQPYWVSERRYGAHTLSYYSVDKYGNVETTKTKSFFVPDNFAPSVGLNSALTNAPYISAADSYSNGLGDPSGLKAVYYRLNGGSWVETLMPSSAVPTSTLRVNVVVPSDGTYTIDYYAVDKANNSTAIQSSGLTVDTTGPTVTLASTSTVSWSGALLANLTVTDSGAGPNRLYANLACDSGVNYGGWSIPWGASGSTQGPWVMDAPAFGEYTYTLTAWATDKAGNTGPTFSQTFVVKALPDTTAPVTTFSVADDITSIESWDGYAYFGLSATDNRSGVVSTKYRVDGGEWIDSQPAGVDNEIYGYGHHIIEYYSVDRAGNTEAIKTSGLSILPPAQVDLQMTNTLYPGSSWFDRNYSYTLMVFDEYGDLLDQYDGNTQDGNGEILPATWNVSSGGPHTVQLIVHTENNGDQVFEWDNIWSFVNQALVLSGEFTDDLTGVDTQAPVTKDNAEARYTEAGAHISILARDPGGSGVAHTYYELDGAPQVEGNDIAVPDPGTTPLQHTLRYWSVDGVGNVETANVVTFTTEPADMTPPFTLSDVQVSYVATATITLTARDAMSGVKATYYSLDDAPPLAGTMVEVPNPPSGTERHTLRFWSVDNFDNWEPSTSVEFTVQHADFVSRTFSFTGAEDTFVVPDGVTELTVDLYGAQGGSGFNAHQRGDIDGGLGGYAHAKFSVEPGTALTVRTGGRGTDSSWDIPEGWAAGGYPNGGSGYSPHGGGGGGSSSISLGPDVLVEAGGGGGGSYWTSPDINGGAQGTEPGGNQSGGWGEWVMADGGGGGGWNGGAGGQPWYAGSGGTSMIAVGRGTLTRGVQLGDGYVVVSWPDFAPPTTTSDAKDSYIGAADITLTADDGAAGSGVAETWYSLDNGVVTPGTSVHIDAPMGGTETHTLEFWSRDRFNNFEEHHSVTFSMGAPNTPGTMISNAGIYQNGDRVSFLAEANGDRTATYYKIDGWTDWNGDALDVANTGDPELWGPGDHSIEYWSVNLDTGAQEPHRFSTLTVAPTGIDDRHTLRMRVLRDGQPVVGKPAFLCYNLSPDSAQTGNWDAGGYWTVTDENGWAVWPDMAGRRDGYEVQLADDSNDPHQNTSHVVNFYDATPGNTNPIPDRVVDITPLVSGGGTNYEVAWVHVRVVDADGNPVAGATVSAVDSAGDDRIRWQGDGTPVPTDADGRVIVPVWTTKNTLTVTANDGVGMIGESAPVYADAVGTHFDGGTITLGPVP